MGLRKRLSQLLCCPSKEKLSGMVAVLPKKLVKLACEIFLSTHNAYLSLLSSQEAQPRLFFLHFRLFLGALIPTFYNSIFLLVKKL